MIFIRNELFSQFPWLKQQNLPMIISADYDGLICASMLHHYLNWNLVGYYDLTNIWISEQGIDEKKNLVWVDLNILPKQGRAIGGHIVSLTDDTPPGFQSSCNPNILANITANKFHMKFPFSTIIYLLWLHKIKIKPSLLARLLILHSDATWLKFQHYQENCKQWQNSMSNYDWKWLFQKINTKTFEKRIDDSLYPILQNVGAISKKSKLKSKHLNITSKQFQFNPDWDEDIILKLFYLFGKNLDWTPPPIPKIIKNIEGHRNKIPLSYLKEIGLSAFLNKNHVFSYAIPSPRIFNFTSFGKSSKSPLIKNNV